MHKNALYRRYPQPCNPLKVAAAVGEEGQAVVQGGGPNEQIDVADEGACGSEAAAFSGEDFDDSLVETKHDDTTKKSLRSCSLPSGSREYYTPS